MGGQFTEVLVEVVADNSKNQDTDILASDFQLTRADSMVRISIAVSSALKISLVPSSGNSFYINGGSNLTAGAVHTEDVLLDDGRTWNLQASGSVTVTHCIIHELGMIG